MKQIIHWLSNALKKVIHIGGIHSDSIKADTVVSGTQININPLIPPKTKPDDTNIHLRNDYLNKVKSDTGILPLEGIDPKAKSCGAKIPLKLSAIYTALMTSGSESSRPNIISFSKESKQISALEHLNTHQHMVLLGDPGSGKSTFVNFVALCLAGEALGDDTVNINLLTQPLPDEENDNQEMKPQLWEHGPLLPLRVILRDFTSSEFSTDGFCVKTLWKFIQSELDREDLSAFLTPMKNEFRQRGGIFLFDGLDEVPEANKRRSEVRDFISGIISRYPKSRVLVTSRTYAYQHQDFRISGLFETVLTPFTDWQVNHFIDQWYLDTVNSRGWKKEDAQGKAVLLKQAVEKSSKLQVFAKRPLLLTLMASLHAWRGGSLPEKREELYADTVDLLLDRWESRKLDHACNGKLHVVEPSLAEYLKTDRDQIRKILDEQAYKAHASQTDSQDPANISEKELVYELINISKEGETIDPRRLVSYLNHRAGILIPQGVSIYTFPHRTFQEYLAACHLTEMDFPDEIADLAREEPNRWREVALLAGAKAARGMASGIWQLAEALCFHPPEHSELNQTDFWGGLLAGQALSETADLKKVSVRNKPKLEKVREWQIRILEGDQLPAVERALAGRNLAQLGDTRKEVVCVEHMSFCLVPKGAFYMGEGEDQHLNKSLNEDFWMGQYPVTNAQYDEFVKAGGYQNQAYWGEAEKTGFWKKGRFKGRYDRSFREKAMDFGMPFNINNHPVVGVTWYEALAFTRWLTVLYQEKGFIPENGRIRLPSEAEWEKTARGGRMIPEYPVIVSVLEKEWERKFEAIANAMEKRSYPWGEQIDKEQANYSETGIGATSAMGCFFKGESPFGCVDLSGNVWEWTRSLYEYGYPYIPSAEREDESAGYESGRVLRGGAFHSYTEDLRCAYRSGSDPYDGDFSVGFRCEFSPNSL